MVRVAMARGMVFNRAKGGGLGADPAAAARLAGVTPEWYVGVTSRLHLNAFRVEIPAIVGDDHSHAHSHARAFTLARAHDHTRTRTRGHDHGAPHPAGKGSARMIMEAPHPAGKGEAGMIMAPRSGGKGSAGTITEASASAGRGDFKAAMEAALFASEAGVGTGSALYLVPSDAQPLVRS